MGDEVFIDMLEDDPEDIQRELYIEKFRRNHPTWTEAEIEAYFYESEPD